MIFISHLTFYCLYKDINVCPQIDSIHIVLKIAYTCMLRATCIFIPLSCRMPGTGPKYFNCIDCGKRTRPLERLYVHRDPYLNYTKSLGLDSSQISQNDVACQKCFVKFKRSLVKTQHISSATCEDKTTDDQSDPDYVPYVKKSRADTKLKSPQNIPLPILSSGKSHSTCCICKKRSPKLITVATESRYKLFVEKGHLLLSGSRCCCSHLDSDKYFKEEALCLISEEFAKDPNTFFNKSDILSLITNIRAIAIRNDKYRIDFDNKNTLSDAEYQTLTGITKDDFEDLCSNVNSNAIRCTKNRSSRTCIALLLVKLRTGLSNRMLSTLFNIGKSSVRRSIVSARHCLATHFTPQYVGFEHITREDVIRKHTRPLAQELFGSVCEHPAILVVDGTYIYIQKSNNFQFQRRSYSMHKHRPLVKPMVMVTTTGYIVSIFRPYFADSRNNDASILKHNISSNMEHMKEWLQEQDLLIVDRGFRDATDFLQDIGISCKMPPFLRKGQKQHTTEEVILKQIQRITGIFHKLGKHDTP